MKIFKSIIALSFIFICSACHSQPEKNYAYLISHPNDLKQTITNCQSSKSTTSYCEMAQRAQQDFASLFNQWQQGPEDFGKRILQLQMTNADISAIAKNNFSDPLDQKQMIAAYLAVVGLTPIE